MSSRPGQQTSPRWPARILYALVCVCVLCATVLGQSQDGVIGSLHDLTVNGPGPVKATTEKETCRFCHAPHNANPSVPLRNQQLSSITSYTPYTSSNFKQNTSSTAPTTRSKLCLSCHDGTVALGKTVANGTLTVTGVMSSSANLGTTMANDHPLGFAMPAADDGEIRPSLTITPVTTGDPSVRLFNNTIECVTCHEPHMPKKDTAKQFMVRSNINGDLCKACHDPARGVLAGWDAGGHATAQNRVNAASGLPYADPATVGTNACMSCHRNHGAAGSGAELQRGQEESNCATCHGSTPNITPMTANIIGELTRTYRHPIVSNVSPPHDPAESGPVNISRHAECADCHNPHSAQNATSTAPLVRGAQYGTSGVQATDGITAVARASNQYEICFKCHANSTNKPQSSIYGLFGRTVLRQTFSNPLVTDPFNTRLDFQSTVARHNVTLPARVGISPSLRSAMLSVSGSVGTRSLLNTSFIYCTDCHNNDRNREFGSAGPNGPHASANEHLLERPYQMNIPPAAPGERIASITYAAGVTGTYALCDKCHDVANSILADRSFSEHRRHVVKVGASCATCHAAHGVQGGASGANSHLINFDTRIVAANSRSELTWNESQKSCALRCHNKNH